MLTDKRGPYIRLRLSRTLGVILTQNIILKAIQSTKSPERKKAAFPHLPPPPPPPVTHPRPLASLASAYSQPAPLSAASNSLPRPPAPCPPCAQPQPLSAASNGLPRPPAPLPLPASCPPCAQPPLAAPDCQPSVTPPTESSLPGYIFSNFQCQVNSIFLNKNTVYCET